MDMPTRKQEKAYEKLSPFEVKNVLIDMASKHARAASSAMLNAGRGNPNWRGSARASPTGSASTQ